MHSNDFFLKVGLIKPNDPNRQRVEYKDSKKVISSSLKKLKSITKGYESVVLVIPSRALWIGTNSQIQLAKKIHTEFIKGLGENNFQFVDMYQFFKNNDPGSFYFKRDGHWNDKGHSYAATELFNFINREN